MALALISIPPLCSILILLLFFFIVIIIIIIVGSERSRRCVRVGAETSTEISRTVVFLFCCCCWFEGFQRCLLDVCFSSSSMFSVENEARSLMSD